MSVYLETLAALSDRREIVLDPDPATHVWRVTADVFGSVSGEGYTIDGAAKDCVNNATARLRDMAEETLPSPDDVKGVLG